MFDTDSISRVLKRISNRKHLKKYIFLFFVISLSLYALWPSFMLHFDGDSYLNLWLYEYYIVDGLGKYKSFFSYFFTDYGPQVAFFTLIYKVVGLKPVYFYIVSYILRLSASFTFYPLIKLITKNKFAAYFSVVFFSVATTGIDTTNWVFNMPSYVAIAIFNLFLFTFLRSIDNKQVTDVILSIVLFIACILIQPIRMSFLPILTITFTFLFIFKKNRGWVTKTAIVYTVIFVLLFMFGNIGSSIGVTGSPIQKLTGSWLTKTSLNVGGLSEIIKTKNYRVFFSLIGQLGYIFLPYQQLNLYDGIVGLPAIIKKLFLPEILLFILALGISTNFSKKQKDRKNLLRYFTLFSLVATVWSALIIYLFHYKETYPDTISQIISLIAGGHLVLLTAYITIQAKPTNRKIPYVLLSIFIIFLGFAIPWIRSPGLNQVTSHRYLIVSCGGMVILSAILISNSRLRTIIIIFIPLLILHLFATRLYLANILKYRSYTKTQKIRTSIPKIPEFQEKNKYPMVYLQGDNEKVLYHSLLFGFPSMLYFYQGKGYIWDIGYTTDWQEVVDAYTTGEGFRKFGTIPIKPADINEIYSLKVEGDKVIDTTQITRNKLMNLK